MRFVKVERVIACAIAMVIGTAMTGCESRNPSTTTEPRPTVSSWNTPSVMPKEVRRSDGGRTYLLEEGWPIPSLAAAEREQFETTLTSGEGRRVSVHRTVIRTAAISLFTGNPLHLIGMGSKYILIQKVGEYRTSAGIFCYQFLVNDADIDESTNEVRSTRGVLYSYSLYDEDGDGVFESLIFDEKDRFGHEGFVGEPHVPEWATAKVR